MRQDRIPSIRRCSLYILAIFCLTACAAIGSAAGIPWVPVSGTTALQSTQMSLSGTLWNLDSYYHDGTMTQTLPGAAITIRFQDDGQITGLSGINRYFGEYHAGKTSLSITGLGSTLMAGPEPLMAQESAYMDLLGTARSYAINGSVLELKNGNGQVVLAFTLSDETGKISRSDPETSLPGTEWSLDSYRENNRFVSGRDVSRITLKFNDQGNLSGFAGVNHYFAEYSLTGSSIAIGPIGSTEMAGPGPLMDLEATYLGLLQSARGIEAGSDSLSFTDSSGIEILTFTNKGSSTATPGSGNTKAITGLWDQPVYSSGEILHTLLLKKNPEYTPARIPVITQPSQANPKKMPRYSDNITPPKTYPGGPFY